MSQSCVRTHTNARSCVAADKPARRRRRFRSGAIALRPLIACVRARVRATYLTLLSTLLPRILLTRNE